MNVFPEIDKLKSLFEGIEGECKLTNYMNFKEVAHRNFESFNFKSINVDELIKEMVKWDNYHECYHKINEFALPSLSLFQNDKFTLNLNFWPSDKFGIHDHNGEGVFTSLRGDLFQGICDYTHEKWLGDSIGQGELVVNKIDKLKPHQIIGFDYSERFIHFLAHTKMGITLLCRTFGPEDMELFNYPKFVIKFNSDRIDNLLRRFLILNSVTRTEASNLIDEFSVEEQILAFTFRDSISTHNESQKGLIIELLNESLNKSNLGNEFLENFKEHQKLKKKVYLLTGQAIN